MRTGQFQRRLAWPLLQALLLAAATGHSGLRAVLAAPLDTAWVSQSGGPCAAPPGSCVTFVDALTNPAVRTMYLVSDVNLTAADFAAYDDAPYHLDRDLLVSSVPGTWRTLAFNFLASKILIGRNVTVTLADMVMTNTRMASGVSIDLFMGSGSSVLINRNAVRWRAVGLDPGDSVRVSSKHPRPPRFPGQQDVRLLNPAGCSEQHPNDLVFMNFAVSWKGSAQDVGPTNEGYDAVLLNVTRACVQIAPAACARDLSRDQCLVLSTDQYQRAHAGGGGGAGASGRSSASGPGVGVAVGAAVGAVGGAAAAGAALWLVLRRRRQRLRRERALEMGSDDLGAAKSRRSTAPLSDGLPEGRAGPLAEMRPKSEGWELVRFLSAPEFADSSSPQDTIELGNMLGRGSFGTVYSARWQGRPVAVKAICHRHGSTTSANEANLILGFEHPNVLKAYHVVQWCNLRASDDGAAQTGSSWLGSGHPPTAPRAASAHLPTPRGAASGACSTPGGGASGQLPAASEQGEGRGSAAGSEWVLRLGTGGSAASNGTPNGGAPTLVTTEELRDLFRINGGAGGGAGGAAGAGAGASGGGGGVAGPAESSGELDRGPSERMPLYTIRSEWQGSSAAAASLGGAVAVQAGSETWLITEYCECGDLERAAMSGLLKRPDGSTDEARVLHLLRDVAAGLTYLHSKNVMHADLKAGNVLLSADHASPLGVAAKVSDFGLSRALGVGQTHASTRTVGTITHMPPELLLAGKLSQRGDVYAFGILIWEAWTGAAAFEGLSFAEVFAQVVMHGARPPVPPCMPPALAALMQSCWDAEPTARPDMRRCMESLEAQIAAAGPEAPAAAAAPARPPPQPATPGAG